MQTFIATLARGPTRAIDNGLETGPSCELAIADRFGDERYIEQAVMAKGRASIAQN